MHVKEDAFASQQKSFDPDSTYSFTGEGLQGSLAGLSSDASHLWHVLQFTKHLLMIYQIEVTLRAPREKHVCLSASETK